MSVTRQIRSLSQVAYHEFKVAFDGYFYEAGQRVMVQSPSGEYDLPGTVRGYPEVRETLDDRVLIEHDDRRMKFYDPDMLKAPDEGRQAGVPPTGQDDPYEGNSLAPAVPHGDDEDEPDLRTAASKYKNKKEVPKQDGKGTTTIYEYSENHLKERAKGKAKKVNHLDKVMDKIIAKAKKDIKSENPEKRLPALAVLLINATYERVGNKGSAEEGHHGVTTWQKKHLTLGKGKATLKYTGKSGVDHKKEITDGTLVKELRTLVYQKQPNDYLFYDGNEDCCLEARDVNAYLKPFKITAKDIRGYHANRLVREKLETVTAATDDDPKAQEKARKDQFKEIIEKAAEEVGHEPSTLRSQYLAPSLEKDFVEKGKVKKTVSAAERTRLHGLLDSVVEWNLLVKLHFDTLNKLIELAENKRKLRSQGIKVTSLDYGEDIIRGGVRGSRGDTYTPYIKIRPRRAHYCTCPDWAQNGRRVGPCKHILSLCREARTQVLDPVISRLNQDVNELEELLTDMLGRRDFN